MIKGKLVRMALGLLCLGFTSVSLIAGWSLYTKLLSIHLAATLVISLEAGRLIFLWIAMKKKSAWILYFFIVAICSLSAIFSFRIEFTNEQQNQNRELRQIVQNIKGECYLSANRQIDKLKLFADKCESKLADATGRHSRAVKSKKWWAGEMVKYRAQIDATNQKIEALKNARDEFLSQIPKNPKNWILINAPKVNIKVDLPDETAIDRAANGQTELLRWILAILIIVVVEMVILSLGRLSFYGKKEENKVVDESIIKVDEMKPIDKAEIREMPDNEMKVATVAPIVVKKKRVYPVTEITCPGCGKELKARAIGGHMFHNPNCREKYNKMKES